MGAVGPQASGLVKKVRVLRREPARDLDRAPTRIHYVEDGWPRSEGVAAGRSTHFDFIETACVHDTLAGTLDARSKVLSARGLARRAYFGANAVWAATQPALDLGAPLFDTRVFEPNNMAHLLLDIIPCCLYARRVAGSDVRFLFRKLQPTFRGLLDVFGIEPLLTRRLIEAEVVRIRGTRGLAVHDLLGTFDCASITSLPEVYGEVDTTGPAGFDRIFLARRGARALLNHAEVEARLARHGYRTVFMEDHPIREQIGIGAQARHVVAIHGAAMAFLAFGRRVESVIELMPDHLYHEMFALCLYPRAPQYHVIVSAFDRAVPHSGWAALAHHKNLPFSVDLGLLERALAESH